MEKITELGEKLGVAFQISDDILDETSTFEEMGKTLGKDKATEKLTYVTLYGIDEAKHKLTCILDECCVMISGFEKKSAALLEIIEGIKKRVGI